MRPAEPARPYLSLEPTSSNVVVRCSGWLETATNVEGPYQRVAGAITRHEAPVSSPQRFWKTIIPPDYPGPNAVGMLGALPADIEAFLAENRRLLEWNPHLAPQFEAKTAMLENPALATMNL